MVHPVFSLWGYRGHIKGPWATCDVPNLVPPQLSPLLNVSVLDTDYVTEGGDKSFNGRGTVLMSRVVELQRNPGKTLDEIERMAKDAFHVSKVVWIGDGVIDDKQSFLGPVIADDTAIRWARRRRSRGSAPAT